MSSVTPSTCVDAAGGKRLTHPGKTLRHKRQAPPARSGQRLAILDRLGIAIESEDAGRPFIEDGLGVAARAERAVDMGLAGGDGERMDDLFGEDGDVGRGGGAAAVMASTPSPRAPRRRTRASSAIAALQRELRVPELEGAADADEQGEVLDLAAAAQHRRAGGCGRWCRRGRPRSMPKLRRSRE